MKTYFFICLLLVGFSLQASAQSDPVERTKERAKNKTNNRIDNKVDQKIDEGLDAIEGLFKRKKKKSKKEDNNENTEENQNEETQNNTDQEASNVLGNIFGGKAEVRPVYNFDGNFVMRMEGYKSNGKKESDSYTRYFNAKEPDVMALQMMKTEKNGTMGQAMGMSIFDAKNQTVVSITDDKQAFAMKMPNLEDFNNAQEQETNQTPNTDMKITRTGKTKNILGYTCYETIMENKDMKAIAWTTKDVPLSQFKAFAGLMAQKKDAQQKMYALPLEFLMEMESTDKKTGEKMKMTVVELNLNTKTTLTMSDYKMMTMPNLGNSN